MLGVLPSIVEGLYSAYVRRTQKIIFTKHMNFVDYYFLLSSGASLVNAEEIFINDVKADAIVGQHALIERGSLFVIRMKGKKERFTSEELGKQL